MIEKNYSSCHLGSPFNMITHDPQKIPNDFPMDAHQSQLHHRLATMIWLEMVLIIFESVVVQLEFCNTQTLQSTSACKVRNISANQRFLICFYVFSKHNCTARGSSKLAPSSVTPASTCGTSERIDFVPILTWFWGVWRSRPQALVHG